MKLIIEKHLKKALYVLMTQGVVPADCLEIKIQIDRAKDKSHGDMTTNLAFTLAKRCGMSPRQLAEKLIASFPQDEQLERVDVAGAGFINFFVRSADRSRIISTVLQEGDDFGRSQIGNGRRVLLEYVSANPTGPLHVGHGRGAAFGATLANVLSMAGFLVHREYYVNDAGRQMDILAVSVWLRYLALHHEPVVFPSNAYRGDYVIEIAKTLEASQNSAYVHPWSEIVATLPKDEPEGGDKEQYIDALIETAKRLLGQEGFQYFHHHALTTVLQDIQDDLMAFGVSYDTWFSEYSLMHDGSIQSGIEALRQAGHTYEQAGALWFRATAFGDEKDRVLVRANGQTTYFASDVAYHWNKYHRGFDQVIDIFGADHHGYVSRLKAAVKALGHDESALNILLVQFAILYRQGERVQMSTRSGSFVTLRELREEVGNDAARFFYVIRKPEQHMDFDLDLAKSETSDNPVYYIQYAHARIHGVLKQLEERGLQHDERAGLGAIASLSDEKEHDLMVLLSRYPDTLQAAALACEPHQIAYYLRDLANGLHSYYNAIQLLCEDEALRAARLCLLKAVRQVLQNGLKLLGVSAPESM